MVKECYFLVSISSVNTSNIDSDRCTISRTDGSVKNFRCIKHTLYDLFIRNYIVSNENVLSSILRVNCLYKDTELRIFFNKGS